MIPVAVLASVLAASPVDPVSLQSSFPESIRAYVELQHYLPERVCWWPRKDLVTPDVSTVKPPEIGDAPFVPDPLPVLSGPVPGMRFAQVPAGTFQMGSPESDEWRRSCEQPQHSVHVDGFELMTTEVTQGMWHHVTGNWPGHPSDSLIPATASWNDWVDFLLALNESGDGYFYRFPSEAEWEYACRARTDTRFFWGDMADHRLVARYCWFFVNTSSGEFHPELRPVSGREPNPWGFYDIVGNAGELCGDLWHEDYENAPATGETWLEDGRRTAVVRGGAGWSFSPQLRSASRIGWATGHEGLRVARSRSLPDTALLEKRSEISVPSFDPVERFPELPDPVEPVLPKPAHLIGRHVTFISCLYIDALGESTTMGLYGIQGRSFQGCRRACEAIAEAIWESTWIPAMNGGQPWACWIMHTYYLSNDSL